MRAIMFKKFGDVASYRLLPYGYLPYQTPIA